MIHTELGEPRPRSATQQASKWQWNVIREEVLAIPDRITLTFDDVLEARRSERRFRPLAARDLSTLLWQSAGTRYVFNDQHDLGHRPTPSAGALHPIHVLVVPSDIASVARYNSRRHTLDWLSTDTGEVKSVRESLHAFMPAHDATLLLFVGEPQLTAARYEEPMSLVWRDAGALQGQFGLVAGGLGLAFCLLGTTGNAWLPRMFGDREGQLTGVGAALVGAMV